VSLVVRAQPKAGAAELGKVFGKDSLVMATGMEGDYISMAHQDRDDPASPPLRGWMLTATDDRVLLSVKPTFLVVPAPGLPDGVQLRVRAAPEGTAAEVKQVSAAPGTIFEVAEQSAEWLRVLMGDAASAWMSSSAQGMPLLKPARRDVFIMDPALAAKHGDAVKLAVRAAPSQDGAPLGEITSKGRVYCLATRGPWLRVLYHGYREAWMLSQTPTEVQLLVPADSVAGGGNAVRSSAPPKAAAAGPPKRHAGAPATTARGPSKSDGNRRVYMVCARQVTVREYPEFYAQDVGVVPEGGIVRVFEEKEEINEAKQTKDVWVRGQAPNTAAAAGSRTGLVEGWLLAFTTKRGSMVAEAPNALAAQHAFEKQEEAATAAAKPAVVDAGPPPEKKAAAAVTAAPTASTVPTTASVGGYMRAAGQLKLREEADSLSLELGTVYRGELVKVEQTSGLWVRVMYRGNSSGWVLTANKRGASLTPAEAGPAAAAKEFQAQEAAAAAAAAAATAAAGAAANGAGDEDRPLTGAKAGSTAASDDSGSGAEVARARLAAAAAAAAAAPPVVAGSSGKGNAASVGQFLTSAGPLKVREEADPFSLDVATMEKGHIVKVLETSDMWVRVSYRGRDDGWVLTANKRGPILLPAEGDDATASREFDAQEARKRMAAAVETGRGHRRASFRRVTVRRRRGWKARRSGLQPRRAGVRSSWRRREDGWMLTANKRGPILVPPEDQASAAKEFDAQEASLAAAAAAAAAASAAPPDDGDRPLTGVKQTPTAAEVSGPGAAAGEDRPLTGGGKGAWVPPSEFPPGHEGGAPSGGGGGGAVGTKAGAAAVAGGGAGDEAVSAKFLTALGFVKVREEADPFSMDLGSVKKGDIVKVLETSKLWVRVCYRGREDGWVLTANKRGPTLVPSEDQDSAAGEFDAQEAAFAANSGGAVPEDPSDRPLTGANPPPAAPTAATGDSEDRPLTGGGKGAWVPPSEFPPGQEDGPVGSGGGGDGGGATPSPADADDAREQADDSAGGAAVSSEYMTALGFVKIREEADPFSMDLGSVKKGDIIKVLETSKLWVRVCYRGREDGWVLTANKRGPTLVPSADQDSAAGEFDAQEAAFAASSGGALPEDPSDRPLTGAKPPPAAASSSVAGDGDERALTGGGKGAWVPPSEFPPGQEDEPVCSGDGGDALVEKTSAGSVVDVAGQGNDSAGDETMSSESSVYMTALGSVKVREEADPFSMDLGSVKKGEIVQVLETSKLWVRVCYRGREDGWVLTANKRGPTLVPSEDQDSVAGEFDAQEAAFASSNDGAVLEDPSDRPLTGAKPPPAAPTAATGDSEDRPLTGGGKGAWVPPSEFSPGQEDEPASSGGSGVVGDDAFSVKPSAGEGVDAGGQADGSAGGAAISPEYLTAMGLVKIREEADPFSMDLGSAKKGDIVKVLETSKLWVRVCYRGREDGWVLTANKRGPTLVPSEDQDSAAGEFDAQEAAFASSSGGAVPEDPSDRPLTGAKPPPAAPTAATGDSEDRPLTGGGKGAWVPPSEFPPGQEDGPVSYGGGGGSTGGVTPGPEDERPLRAAQKAEGGEGAASGEAVSGGDEAPVEYMKALGVIKLREEADPFSMDLGVVQKEHVVKVLEMKDLWARVAYRGKTDGWVLTQNKRGKMLTAAEDQEEAEAAWAEQEQNASQDDGNGNVPPESRDDRPIGGKRSTQHDGFDPGADSGGLETTGAASSPSGNGGGGVLDTSSQVAVGMDGGAAEPPAGGLKPWQRRRKVASSRKPAAEQGGAEQAEAAAAAPPAKPWQRRGAAKSDPLADGTEEAVSAAAPAKSWHSKKAGALPKDSTAEVGSSAGDEADDSAAAAEEAAAPVKPWLRKKRPGGGVRAGAVDDGGSNDKPGGDDAVVAKPWEAAARAASETVEEAAVVPEGVGREAGDGGGGAGGGEDGLAGLEACLEERDWKKRVAVFEAASRACRSHVEGAAGTVGPLLPRMLQDKNVQVRKATHLS
ncbi:unnamed protein product, partial [Ectocarpus sp. 4 AP-2014]